MRVHCGISSEIQDYVSIASSCGGVGAGARAGVGAERRREQRGGEGNLVPVTSVNS